MAGSVNRAIIVGNVGVEPEIRNMQSGDRVANLSIATSETWKDKSGERQEKTQWHKVSVFNQNIVKVIESYVHKGSKLFIEGSIETRKWDKDGVPQYTTEIVIKPFNGQLIMLDSKNADAPANAAAERQAPDARPAQGQADEFFDEIPWA